MFDFLKSLFAPGPPVPDYHSKLAELASLVSSLDVDARRAYDEEIENYLADNQQAWALDAEGRYLRIQPGEAMPHAAQQSLLARLCGG